MGLILSLSGCTIGPNVKTQYVIINPGSPCVVLENKETLVRPLTAPEDTKPEKQDIGGWVTMPFTHWDVIKKKLEEKK